MIFNVSAEGGTSIGKSLFLHFAAPMLSSTSATDRGILGIQTGHF
jgi:hypothetical protein